MYSRSIRNEALLALTSGESLAVVSRRLGIARSTLRVWRESPSGHAYHDQCPVCSDTRLDEASYSALLGFYLGDGCLSSAARYVAFRVSCDAGWPGVVDDVVRLMARVRPGMKVFRVRAPGCIVVQSHWKHWPCLFPQHGPGRKHEREIRLEPWQRDIVERFPGDFLRGLFHSDGSRTANWARRTVAGVPKRYDYPRWEFVNRSDDILDLCAWALDLCGIAWRRPRATAVAVSRRDDVRRLDALIGLKT